MSIVRPMGAHCCLRCAPLVFLKGARECIDHHRYLRSARRLRGGNVGRRFSLTRACLRVITSSFEGNSLIEVLRCKREWKWGLICAAAFIVVVADASSTAAGDVAAAAAFGDVAAAISRKNVALPYRGRKW